MRHVVALATYRGCADRGLTGSEANGELDPESGCWEYANHIARWCLEEIQPAHWRTSVIA
ncbi:hypothetical protein IAQ61_011254 [Plenodomus lingam]|uniref:uncharacterized protein n=1 Tax=Leptosphaeria maculans TaxID=5022 RepID=UPI00331B82D6|nr:hypothetical protein IAQ61_011254 [Plenodomus lingam]